MTLRSFCANAHGLPLALVSGAVVCYEIGLTRLFSFLLQYHFTFLVVSGAICGLGLGALLVCAWRPTAAALDRPLALLALATAAALWLATGLIASYPRLGTAALVLLATLPLVGCGAFIAVLFRARAADSQRLYFYDLSGAALGILWTVPALSWLGAVDCLLSAATACALAGALLAAGQQARGWRLGLWGLALGGVLAFGIQQSRPFVRIDLEALAEAADKPMFRGLSARRNPGKLVETRWSAYARTDLVDRSGDTGLNLYTDGGAGSYMFRFDGDLRRLAFLRREAALFPYFFGPRQRALILGPGGGADVLYALMTGWQQIEGVEINAEIVALMHQYGDYNGQLYNRQNVHLAVADGRNYAERATGPYDLIALPLVYAEAADLVGFQLLENYLFTQEAFARYLELLQPDGRLALIVHNHTLMLRVVATLASLRQDQGEDPAGALDHLVVLHGTRAPPDAATAYRPLILYQKTPYTPDQIRQLQNAAADLDLRPYALAGRRTPDALAALGRPSLAAWCAAAPQAVHPISDDRPFFYNTRKQLDGRLSSLLWVVGLLTAALVAWPSWRGRSQPAAPAWTPLLFAAGLGSGFMLIEIFLLQRFSLFLGYPTLSLATTLFALLLSTGAGSLLGARLDLVGSFRGIAAWAGLIAVAAAFFAAVQSWLLPAALSLGIGGRTAVALALTTPLGLCLGIPFPALLRLAGYQDARTVPWIWAVNGAASVWGSAAAVALALTWGTGWALWAGATAYLVIAAVGLLCPRTAPLAAHPTPFRRRYGALFALAAALLWYAVFAWTGTTHWNPPQTAPLPPPTPVYSLWPPSLSP